MTVQIIGTNSYGGTIMDVDANKNTSVTVGVPGIENPYALPGGFFMTCGTSGTVAASLAANTPLMCMRLDPSSGIRAYIDRIRLDISVTTVGTSALVAGVLGMQRFTGAAATGGTARLPARRNPYLGTTSMMYDIRDSNAALTVTGITFTDIIASTVIPLLTVGGVAQCIFDFSNTDNPYGGNLHPVVMYPGDGIGLRTQVACPITQTWTYDYTVFWHEV